MSAALRVREQTRDNGFVEIAVYRDEALVGVVTRQPGAPWFVYWPKRGLDRAKHSSRKKALAALGIRLPR